MKKYGLMLPFIIGIVSYFIFVKKIFAKDVNKDDKVKPYLKKQYGDKEKVIGQESPEKLMFNVR